MLACCLSSESHSKLPRSQCSYRGGMWAASSRRSARPLTRQSQRTAVRSLPLVTVFHPVSPQIGHVSVIVVTSSNLACGARLCNRCERLCTHESLGKLCVVVQKRGNVH